MNKKFKILCTIVLSLLIIISNNSFKVDAATSNESSIQINEKSLGAYLTKVSGKKWENIKILKDTNLYDFDNKLVAHNLDLQNIDTNEEGYVIISQDDNDEPILEFSLDAQSPYARFDSGNDITFIYSEMLGYYTKESVISDNKSNNIYYDIINNDKLSDTAVKFMIESDNTRKYKSQRSNNEVKKLRSILSNPQDETNSATDDSSIKPYSSDTVESILSVPDYSWTYGCVPTSAAMILEYDYPSKMPSDENTLMYELSNAMGTDPLGGPSGGGTQISKIPQGIRKVCKNHGVTVLTWNDGYGRSNSTYSEYISEIDSNHPLMVILLKSTLKTPAYSDGFGNHGMAGVGYSYNKGDNSKYIIVHDTAVEGDVYLNFNASGLGTNIWNYVH